MGAHRNFTIDKLKVYIADNLNVKLTEVLQRPQIKYVHNLIYENAEINGEIAVVNFIEK